MIKQLAAAAALSLLAPAALAEKPMEVKNVGVPGVAEGSRSVKITAAVTAVNKETRELTLKGKDGKTETLAVGPQVKRFDEVAVGDTLVVEYEEGLALEFQLPDEKSQPLDVAVVGGKAGKDQAPGGAVAAAVTATVTVTAIDLPNRMVVIQGPQGNYHQVKAGKNVQLDRLKVGDRLFATYTRAVAINLEKAKKDEKKDEKKPEKKKDEKAK
jgi:hypothetical protein